MQVKRNVNQLAENLAKLIDFSTMKENFVETALSVDMIPGGMWFCKINKGVLGLEHDVTGGFIHIKSKIIPKPDRFTLRKMCAKIALAKDYLKKVTSGNNIKSI